MIYVEIIKLIPSVHTTHGLLDHSRSTMVANARIDMSHVWERSVEFPVSLVAWGRRVQQSGQTDVSCSVTAVEDADSYGYLTAEAFRE